MTMISIGDMAQSFALRARNTAVKEQMMRLTTELTSGQTANVSKHLGGDFSYLSDIERSLSLLEGFQTATNEAASLTGAMQLALENIQTSVGDLSNALLSTASGGTSAGNRLSASQAEAKFTDFVRTLNADFAGRSLFAGAATDRQALAPAEQMLANLRVAVSGASSAQDVADTVSVWFDTSGGDFEATGYLGSDRGFSSFPISNDQSVNLDLKADNEAIRKILKFTAMAALATDSSVTLSNHEQAQLHQLAAEGLIGAQDQVTGIRADLGFAEARIEEAQSRVQSERTSYEYARGQLLGIDPYETATQLEDVQFQLESIYAVTARMSRLSLVDYMK